MNKQRIKEIRKWCHNSDVKEYVHMVLRSLPDALDYIEKIEAERDEAVKAAKELGLASSNYRKWVRRYMEPGNGIDSMATLADSVDYAEEDLDRALVLKIPIRESEK